MDFEKVIEKFQKNALDIDCHSMVLKQRNGGTSIYRGQGYVRQNDDGGLNFKIYVDSYENVDPYHHLSAAASRPGKLFTDDMYYDLVAAGIDGTIWMSDRLYPCLHWNMIDKSVVVYGEIDTLRTDLGFIQPRYHQCFHFFEELDVPLNTMSETERNGRRWIVLDSAEFKGMNSDFSVRKREGSGRTVVDVYSDERFPDAFNLRVQEALQYISGVSTIWRARVEGSPEATILELKSQQGNPHRSRFSPPILPQSIEYRQRGWDLFIAYLTYVINNTAEHLSNPVAYHLYIAREASTSTVDAAAVGVAVALEAIASMVSIPVDPKKAERLDRLLEQVRAYVATLTEFSDFADRVNSALGLMKNRRPQDVMYFLAGAGAVDKAYIKSWSNLRNRQVHPKLSDLKPFDLNAFQNTLDDIRKAEVLVHQLVFHLIDYTGPFTDYGLEGYPIRPYPLTPRIENGAISPSDDDSCRQS